VLAAFFEANLTPEYISHGDIQAGLADGFEAWPEDLQVRLVDQFRDSPPASKAAPISSAS
jgi:hypothetical protein